MTLPELLATQTTITQLNPAQEAKASMVLAVDNTNETTGQLETLKLSVEQLLALVRLQGNEAPTGTPLPWLTPTIPAGYISENAEFDPLQFPELAQVFPDNRTPSIAGRVLKGTTSFAATGSHEADQGKAHSHQATFAGAAVANHSHTMAHTHTQQRLATFESTQSTNDASWGQTTVPATGWSRSRQVSGSSGSPIGMRFNNANVPTGGASAGYTGGAGAHTPAGSVTVNNDGGSEVRVKSILCRYMFRAR
ncbi:hypothetical protein NVP1166O_23 [Vibrio phage 1.166.O._10N.261.51.C7]|nr:hypothetical protein NVP1166O_23 [Vibrio phage 1.166.O._10N.261.51.C7]